MLFRVICKYERFIFFGEDFVRRYRLDCQLFLMDTTETSDRIQ
jgi:hypothetical protein